MKVYKFTIQPGHWIQDKDNPSVEYQGMFAAVIAEDRASAIERLKAYAAENDLCSTWLSVARTNELELSPGAVIGWVET